MGTRILRYTKPALPVADQLNLLEKRGLLIPDRAAAERALAHTNYYRLRGYWIVMEEQTGDDTHRFRPGSSFDTALALYEFDQQLRTLVMQAVDRVEVSVRTQWAYQLGTTYGSHAYLDQNYFYDAVKHADCLSTLREEIDRSHEVFIKHYAGKYTDPALPPIWAACEVMSLGSLSKWIENIKLRADRKKIADPYDVDEATLSSFLHHLTTVRNLCAHHCRLWNRRFTVTMQVPTARPFSLVKAFYRDKQAERRVHNTLLMLAHFMNLIAPRETWHRRIRALIESTPVIDAATMGFPPDWKTRKFWRDA